MNASSCISCYGGAECTALIDRVFPFTDAKEAMALPRDRPRQRQGRPGDELIRHSANEKFRAPARLHEKKGALCTKPRRMYGRNWGGRQNWTDSRSNANECSCRSKKRGVAQNVIAPSFGIVPKFRSILDTPELYGVPLRHQAG